MTKTNSIFNSSSNTFEKQIPGETVIFSTRKHWFNIFGPCFLFALLALIPFFCYHFINSLSFYNIISPLLNFLVILYYLIIWNIFFYNIMIYFLNTLIITDMRIIENEQKGLFNHTVNELELSKVQDISVYTIGPLATFLDFGDINVQSAGAVEKFLFDCLPHPKKIKEIIMSAREKCHLKSPI